VTLSGAQEVPVNGSTGTATFVGTYNDATNLLKYTVTFSGLSTNTMAAHFHAPAPPGISAGVVFAATGFPTGVTSGSYTDSIVLSSGQEDTLKMGLWYFNIHTTTFPNGELRAQIFLQDPAFVIPDIHCPHDTTVSNNTGLCSASVAFAAIDSTAKPPSTLYYRIGNTAIVSPYVFPVGATRVIATALNIAGFDTCAFTVTVRDTQPPVITCPANITRPNDPGQCGAVVSFSATATDNCSGVVVTYDHAPGSFFAVGTTTVHATATDASGNTSNCSFTVTVNDVEPPVIHDLKTSPHVLWPPNHKLRNVNVNYTATDNCPGTISCVITVRSNEPVGGPGNGIHAGVDWVIIDDHHIKLRAERDGHGHGRIYTVSVACTDQHSNTTHADTTVLVPHDMRNRLTRMALGIGTTTSKTVLVMNEEDPDHTSIVQVYPNPTNNYFTINIESANSSDKISVRLIDVVGRVMEVRDNLSGSQTIRMGEKLKTGYYIAEIRQGNESKLIKLMKQQ